MKTTNKTILAVMYIGDLTAESKHFESKLIEFFKKRRLQGDEIQIIKAKDDDHTQLGGVYSVKESRKIENLHISLSAFVGHVADRIGFEIAKRQQTSNSYTLVNESGFKLSVTEVEA